MTEQVSFSSDYLKCPILLDYYEDPVQTTCCGKWISRDPFVQCYDTYQNCPLCHIDLDENEDPRNLQTIKDLQYLCEEARKNNFVLPTSKISGVNALYTAKLHCLTNNVTGSMIGQLNIASSKKLNFKTLLIPVLDKSGSMSGSPFNQCKYSMDRLIDLTYLHKHLVTNIITYSDSAQTYEIGTHCPDSYYKNLIAGMSAGGGTSFTAAFSQIIQVLKKYSSDPDISSAIIVFLTDGDDSRVTKDNRGMLVTNLQKQIQSAWTKDYNVHTIGFGGAHDADFLDSLRKMTPVEGAYRFADPSENTDSLSVKINSILDVVTSSMIIPIKILSSDIKILGGEHTKYWARISPIDCLEPRTITISVSGDQHTILLGVDEDQNDIGVWDEWYTHLTSQLITEVMSIPKSDHLSLEHEIHLGLLEQRTNAIMMKVSQDSDIYNRLLKVSETIENVKAGKDVDKLKMNDLKYEGKFKSSHIEKLSCNVKSIQKDVEYVPKVQYMYKKSYNFIDNSKVRRFDHEPNSEIGKLFGGKPNSEIIDKIQSDSITDLSTYCDLNLSNAVVFTSAIGRVRIVEALLKNTSIDPEAQNNAGYNAVDLALIFGHELTSDTLLENGNWPTTSIINQLFLTCVHNNFFRTADVMIKHKLIEPVESMIQYFYDSAQIEFISTRLVTSVGLDTAIAKGMFNRVQELLPTIKTLSWKPYYEILQKSSIDHIRIFKLLVDSGKANPFEVFTLPVKYEDGSSFDEEVWPLFLAGRRGQYAMFSQIMKYYNDPAELNKQNNNGNTLLWIASDGGHSDIVSDLLGYGVDPNVQNLKGDSALTPACQKGYETIVRMLIDSGASLDAYNKNRDNPILICCRSGQAKILELLLNHVSKEEVRKYLVTYAEIDGFVPLHASTELDKLECIKVLYKLGANLEHKTSDDNQIIKGGTALHLACYYGRLNSVMVLVNLGSDIKATMNVNGQTALHIAISRGHTNIVRYLLSLDAGRECLEVEDSDSRLPSYYANMIGNDAILEEFFTNKLEKLLCNVLVSHPALEKLCAKTIVDYGESPLCYEYDGILANQSVLTMALLNGNQHLVDAYLQIDSTKGNKLLLKNDEFGVPPLFWLQYLGYPTEQLALTDSASSSLSIMFDRLNLVKSQGMQNKMLCHLQPVSHKLLEGGKQPSIVDKQNSGMDIIVPNSAIENLRKSSTVDYPLSGFMDKLKSSKVFPDGEQILQYILLDAKYNVIRRVVSGETTLQPLHMMALYLYTAHYDIFKQVNMVLRDLNQTNFWFPFVNILYKAIELIEPYQGEVYRAVESKFDLTKYAIGETLTWNHFSISSYEWKNSADMISKKSGIIFIIKSKTGRKISRYSKYPVDCEVAFLPNTTFAIRNYYVPNVICLAQENIRNSTFRIKESDIKKALAGDASIVIELEEV
jgi:ankyrin repeat protein